MSTADSVAKADESDLTVAAKEDVLARSCPWAKSCEWQWRPQPHSCKKGLSKHPAHWAPLCDPVVKLSARTQGANFSGGTGIGTAVSEYADDMRVLWGLL